MKIAKSAVASLVAAGLVVAPVAAQAAPMRAPSQVSESEELVGSSLMLYLALAAAAAALLVFVVLDDDDDADDLPASP
jgi:hypothetical protein